MDLKGAQLRADKSFVKVKAGGAAVLSCPAYFSDDQRDVMAAAGEDAGLVVLDTIDEPVVRLPTL